MSLWEKFDLENKIIDILSEIQNDYSDHHFNGYVTAYQLAIKFSKDYPHDFNDIGKEIGGKDINENTSLSQYFANQLSRRIDDIDQIDGSFLSSRFLEEMTFEDGIKSSVLKSRHGVSIFRRA